MKSIVETFELLKSTIMPAGIYNGVWSGYQVEVVTPKGHWHLRTSEGIRGTAKCKVIVDENHAAIVET